MRKENNNDTNLSFGDYNKFFVLNQGEKERGSISDEIVFFVPIVLPDGSQEMSFVMDRIYGSKSSNVLMANISVIYKKYKKIKNVFPAAKLSVTVSEEALKSVGLDDNLLQTRLQEFFNNDLKISVSEKLTAFIPESALSDNYVEFGQAGARQHGTRELIGSIIK
jgi:hypothetical protein